MGKTLTLEEWAARSLTPAVEDMLRRDYGMRGKLTGMDKRGLPIMRVPANHRQGLPQSTWRALAAGATHHG